MAWILDEYSKFHGHSPAVVTGKPIVSLKCTIPLGTVNKFDIRVIRKFTLNFNVTFL